MPTQPTQEVNFLLSLQVLLDLCGTRQNPATAWAQATLMRRLRLSVLTVAIANARIERATDPSTRRYMTARMASLLAQIKADGGPTLAFTETDATRWQDFILEPLLAKLPQPDMQLYATAFARGLCVVEYDHAHSAALKQLGITVHSLGPRP